MKIRITNDLYSIAERLKEIDDGYFILYNKKSGRYEVHSSKQHHDTYCLAVPYDCLDARTVELVKSTRREYMDNILNEIERNNKKFAI